MAAVELVAGEKVKGESKLAIIACNDYLRMGLGRSLQKLCDRYHSAPESPPTKRLKTLKDWSVSFCWQARADAYDAAIEAEKTAAEKARQQAIAERRRAVMEDGVAFDFERVALLKKHAEFLEEQIFYQPQVQLDDPDLARRLGLASLLELADATTDADDLDAIARRIIAKLDPNDPKAKYPHVWAQDVKGLAGGKTYEVVRFNAALLSELRATLADIAAETGGRRQRTITENIDYGKLTDDQLQRVAAGEDPIQVILSDYASRQS